MTVERDWFWFWFWFYYALWLASVLTLVLVLRQSSGNLGFGCQRAEDVSANTGNFRHMREQPLVPRIPHSNNSIENATPWGNAVCYYCNSKTVRFDLSDYQELVSRGPTPCPFIRTMFGRKGTPFIYPIVYNFVSL